MLGDEFPEQEIDAIIKEADLTKDGKISYTEFLALWEDQHETMRETAYREISMLPGAHGSDHSGSSSSLGGTEDEPAAPETIISRANFIEKKKEAIDRRRSSSVGSLSEAKAIIFDEGTTAYTGENGKEQVGDGTGSSNVPSKAVPVVMSANV